MWTWHFSWSGAFKMTNPHRVLCGVAVFLQDGACDGFLPVLEGLSFCSCFTQYDLPRDSLFKEIAAANLSLSIYLFIRLPQQYPGLVCKYYLKIGNSFKLHFYLFCVYMFGGQRTSCRSWSSASTMLVLAIKLKLSGLFADTELSLWSRKKSKSEY